MNSTYQRIIDLEYKMLHELCEQMDDDIDTLQERYDSLPLAEAQKLRPQIQTLRQSLTACKDARHALSRIATKH
jgi:prefoldin subunit 5